MGRLLYVLKSFIKTILMLFSIFVAAAIFINAAIPFGKQVLEYAGYKGMVVGYVSDYYERKDTNTFFLESLGYSNQKPETKYPIVTYMVGDAKYEHKGVMEIGSYPYQTGIQINMRYNPYNPELSGYDLEIQSAYIRFAAASVLALIFLIIAALLSKNRPAPEYREFGTHISTEMSSKPDKRIDPVLLLSKKVKKKKNKSMKSENEPDNASNWESSGNFKRFEDILDENIRKNEE